MKITKIGLKGINLIKKYEGCELIAYLCPAKVWTIGVGSTYYENGERVKEGDKITQERAEELLKNLLVSYEKSVDSFTRDDINQNQFDALVSFAYNCGVGNLKSSTLLKKVNINPNDKSIITEFLKWTKSTGKTMQGLINRRTDEAQLYFS